MWSVMLFVSSEKYAMINSITLHVERNMWGRTGVSGPPTPRVQPPYPRPVFPPYPRPLFSLFFFGYPRPNSDFWPPAPAHLTPPPYFSSQAPLPPPHQPRAPNPPVLPPRIWWSHIFQTYFFARNTHIINVTKPVESFPSLGQFAEFSENHH